MLAPDSRTILIDQLTPPPGHQFEAAVATTFTLDLTATLLPALAFTGFHLAGGVSDPIATLESVRSMANRIDVYCQAGAIGVPEQAPDLLAFLEPMIHPVRPPGAGLFHPKIWFIKYVNDERSAAYRLLVLSRNLTMDSSWDLAVRLDSESATRGKQKESAALADLIRSLPDRSTTEHDPVRRDRVLELAEEAARVVWELPSGADEVRLHYLEAGRRLSMNLQGSRHLVVSPFVDASGLKVVSGSGPIEILSRAEELEKLDETTVARLSARVMDELAVVQQIEESRLGGQLHAKMYVVEQAQNWSKSHVFIGSANATGAGFHLNTEFMVELRGHRKHFGIDQFLGDDGAFVGLTETYKPTGAVDLDSDDGPRRELENAVRRLAGMAFSVEVLGASKAKSAEGLYDLRIQSERSFELEPGWFATVELLTLPDFSAPVAAKKSLDAVVQSVATGDISPFLALRVESTVGLRASTVIVAELINAPADRLDVVLARQIDTPEKFLRFLFFLLSLGNPAALAGLATSQTHVGTGSSPFGNGGSGVLEMVLGAMASRPAALADLDVLISRLESTDAGMASLPDGFLNFWAVVRETAGLDTEKSV